VSFSFAKNSTPVSLQLTWKYQFQFAGYIMAKEKGFYNDVGIEVDIVEYQRGKNPTSEVQSRNAQFGIGRSDLILESLNNSIDFVQLFALCQASPVQLQSVRENNVSTIEDLKGKKYLFYDDKEFVASISSMLHSFGLSEKDFEFVQSKKYSPIEIVDGTADLVTGYSTITPYHLKRLGYEPVSFHPKDYGFDFYGDILFTTKEFMHQNPRLVENFYKASIKGWKYAFNNVDETIETIKTKYNTQDLERDLLEFEANEYRKLAFVNGVEFGEINPIKLEKIANTFKLLGKTNSAITDFSDFVYSPSLCDVVKLKFEESGIKLTFGWTLFWQIISFIALVVVFILYGAFKNKQTEKERLAEKVEEKTKNLQKALDENALLLKELKNLAQKDHLTKLYNRRYFETIAKEQLALARREKNDIAIIILDIDDFKKVNDTYGHQMGDRVLCCLADILTKYKRESDVVTRYGGEEFIISLPNTSLEGASVYAENLRKKVESQTIQVDEVELTITISLGLTMFNPEDDVNSAIDRADQGLYTSKRNGKNQVSIR
jgi:diguanylate cyclase (GGDEF)-like protein